MCPGYNRPNCRFIEYMVLQSRNPHAAITPKYDGFHIVADFSKVDQNDAVVVAAAGAVAVIIDTTTGIAASSLSPPLHTQPLAELVSHGGVVLNGNNGGHTLEAIFRRLRKHKIRRIRPDIDGIKAQRVRFEFVALGESGGLHGLMSGEWAKTTTNPFEIRVFDAEWETYAIIKPVKYTERLAAIERAYPARMRVSRLDTRHAVAEYMRLGEGVIMHDSVTDKAYKIKAPRPLALRLLAARKGPGVVEAKLQDYIYTQFFFGCLRTDDNKNSDMVALCCMDYTEVLLRAAERKVANKTTLNPKAILERRSDGVIGSFSKSCVAPTICRLLNLVKRGPLIKQRDMSEERVRFHENDGGRTIFTGKARTFTIDEHCVFFANPPRVTISANDAWKNTPSGTIHLQAPTILCFGHHEWTDFPDGRGIRYPLLRELVAARAFRDLALFRTMARCKKDLLCELVETIAPSLVVNWGYPRARLYRPPPPPQQLLPLRDDKDDGDNDSSRQQPIDNKDDDDICARRETKKRRCLLYYRLLGDDVENNNDV